MQINQEQIQQFIRWLSTHWVGGQHCTVCNHTDWAVNDRVFELSEYFAGLNTQPVVQPVLTVMCKNCGHAVHFNAIHVGILSPEKGGA